MSLEIRIYFTGLSALVLDKSISATDNMLTAVLTNSKGAMEAHFPVIMVADTFKPTGRGGFKILQSKTYGGDMYGFPLGIDPTGNDILEDLDVVGRDSNGNDILSLSTSPAGGNSLQCDNNLRTSACPTHSDYTDIGWLLKPNAVGAGQLQAGVLSQYLPALVSARIKLTQGRLTSNRFRIIPGVPPALDQLVEYVFPAGSAPAAVAEEVMFHFVFGDPSVTQLAFNNRVTHSQLVLLPQAPNNVVEAWVVNLPAPDILELRKNRPLDADSHFVEFYRLSTNSGITDVPTPSTTSFCTPYQGVANPKCPPALFAP